MSLALLSLLALAVAILVSCFTPINVGFLSIALAFVIGFFAGGMKVAEIIQGFPVSLFLTLTGITLLFSQARDNGTLGKVARFSVRLARGNRGLVPIIFFGLALSLATIGAGNIAATALLAPVAMAVAGEVGVSAFLMALMVANGANAGAFSPFSPTGIIAANLMERAGMPDSQWSNFLNTLVAQSAIALSGYFVFGGARLFRRDPEHHGQRRFDQLLSERVESFTGTQMLTIAAIGSLILAAVLFKVDVGMGAFVCAVILSVFRAADEESAIRSMPWGVILMVSGVTVLIGILDRTGGMELFTRLLANLSGPTYVAGAMALVTGIISVYSSSSGVVLPAFLPTIPGLVRELGGGNPLMIAYSINVGAHLVDVSPLSTLGALCLAAAAPHEDRTQLFRKLMAWGLSMSLVGGAVCQLLFGYR